MSIELTGQDRIDVLASLDYREDLFRKELKHYNTTLPFKKKETYKVQGFDVKGITLGHARKRLRKFLLLSGFNPEVNEHHFAGWRKELSEVVTEEE